MLDRLRRLDGLAYTQHKFLYGTGIPKRVSDRLRTLSFMLMTSGNDGDRVACGKLVLDLLVAYWPGAP